ncbi:NAD(P)-binding protein [Linderina pennispora]|uniref:NAD(P)-binding protein n=1 Tax=Linderina pennispora TaxID=61395 RepID=A0A1Y1WL65_9FUNG|nr:NAD(P)-binding protein [Linderina pennispora]ORX73834.1 NAD(P)-binding protein [Linderina pennispora]
MVEGLVAAGARVYITSRSEQVLKEASQSLTAQGPGKCDYIVCDITDPEQVQQLAHKLTELEPNGLHALINNCGRTYVANYNDHPDDEFLMSKTLLPLLKRVATKECPTRIINITSAGLIHLTKDMAQKFAPDNITVNSISPGSIDSPMLRDTLPEDFFMQLPDLVPLRRLGNTIGITGAVVFLAANAPASESAATAAVAAVASVASDGIFAASCAAFSANFFCPFLLLSLPLLLPSLLR